MKAIDVHPRPGSRFAHKRRPAVAVKLRFADKRNERRAKISAIPESDTQGSGAFEVCITRMAFLFAALGIFQALIR